MQTDKIIILEGYNDLNQRAKNVFEAHEKEYRQFNNLFNEPHKLRTVANLNPEYVYIHTTGMMHGKRKQGHKDLRAVFSSMNWIPDNVIFGSEDSVMAYLDIARKLKEAGTKFYLLGFKFGDDFKREINWI